MNIVMILKGLPASYKSTFAKDLVKREPNKWVRINRDDLRAMFHNSIYSQDNEEFVRKTRDRLIVAAIRDNKNVIVDDTNLVPATRKKIHNLCSSLGDITVIEKSFNVDVEECIRRNTLREGIARVPEKVIRKLAHAAGLDRGNVLKDGEVYYPPRDGSQNKIYAPDDSLPKAIMCDLDGTIADLSHRSPYDASKCLDDKPIAYVVELVQLFYAAGYKIIFCSGREDMYMELTKQWLDKHVGVEYILFMRPTGNAEKDAIIKERIFNEQIRDKFNVRAVIDDRLQVCQQWFAMGLPLFRAGDPDAVF